jgi:hypothetical protein
MVSFYLKKGKLMNFGNDVVIFGKMQIEGWNDETSKHYRRGKKLEKKKTKII